MRKLGIDQWGSTRDEGWNIRSAGEVANAYNKLVKTPRTDKIRDDEYDSYDARCDDYIELCRELEVERNQFRCDLGYAKDMIEELKNSPEDATNN